MSLSVRKQSKNQCFVKICIINEFWAKATYGEFFRNLSLFILASFHSRKLNVCISRLHERALRVVYRDFDSSFEELLGRGSSTTLHQRNLQKQVTEIFKIKTGIAPELMKGVFEFTDVPYNLRNQSKCNRSIPCTERYGIETASSIGPKLWDKASTEIKNSKSLEEFKVRIKSWVPKNCPCKICKLFIKHVGYL